jgi:hypothetical protein
LVHALWTGNQGQSNVNCELTISVTGHRIALLTYFLERLSPQPASGKRR